MVPLEIVQPKEMVLDGTKIRWYADRVAAWERGERIAPVTIDAALTRSCNAKCGFCYAHLQANEGFPITEKVAKDFLDDAREIGVKGVSFVSDGESTINPCFASAVEHGYNIGLDMASGTNAINLFRPKMERLLKCFTYLRVNISAGTRDGYKEVMGVDFYDQVVQNIRDMVEIKRQQGLGVTLGIQMVVTPDNGHEVVPFAKLGKDLGVDYAVCKHCSTDEDNNLNIDYSKYERMYDILREAELYSADSYSVVVKWRKIEEEGKRSYKRCYGALFLLQMSGSGLVAPCGMLFNSKYSRYHLGNICEKRFKDIWASDEYWAVMNHLASPNYNAQCMCGSLCLQHYVNTALDRHVKGIEKIEPMPEGFKEPMHLSFI